MTSVVFPMLGLALDQHPSIAPKGAMSQADNVVGDLPGMIRGRPNTDVIFEEDPLDPDPYAPIDTLIRTSGEHWIAHQDGSGSDAAWRNALGVVTGFTAGSRVQGAPAQYAQSRGSTYIGTSEGVAKLDTANGTSMVDAGVEMSLAPRPFEVPTVATSNAPPGPFTSPFAVGYRLVIKRTDVNGYVARSAPSGIYVPVDPTTAAANPVLLFDDTADQAWYFPAGSVIEGDIIEFYRSRIVGSVDGPLAPDYYLVTTYEITAANISDGFFPAVGSGIKVYDTLEDDQLGEALYTNPGRGGALAAKYSPPTAGALAWWAGVMWYGNVLDRARAGYQMARVGGGTPANRASDGQSLGVTTLSSGITNGSADISVSSIDGIRVGMYVFDSPSQGPQTAGDFPALTQVLSIAGAGPYTVTASAAAIGATGSVTLYFGDYIDIDGTRFFATITGSNITDRGFGVSNDTDPGVRAAATAYSMALAVNAWMVANGGEVRIVGTAPLQAAAIGGSAGRFVVEALEPDGTATIGPTSAPFAFSPAIEKQTDVERAPGQERLMWSDPDEPEAVRLLSFADVGRGASQILALTPLHDALLVWKQDGLFRVTGTAPDRWSIDVLDPTLVLSRPGAVDVLRGTAYAVTNRGFVAVNEGGVVGLPAQGKVETLFREPTLPMVVAWERLGLVLVADAVAMQEGSVYANTVYCYASATGVWSRWPSMYLSAFGSADAVGSPLTASSRPDLLPMFEVREFSASEGRGYDHVWGSIAYTIGADGECIVADADRGAWYPTAGDWLRFGFSTYSRVIGVVLDGTDWVLTLDVPLVDGGGDPAPMFAYEGAPVQIEIMPSSNSTQAPFSLPVWREASWAFSNGPAGSKGDAPARLTFGVRDDFGLSTILAEVQRSTVSLRPYRIGWPRNSARRAAVWPRLGFSEIDWSWRLSGVSLVGSGGSEKVRR